MSVTCSRAADIDRADMHALWLASFENDTAAEVDVFLDRFFDTALVAHHDGQVVSMLFLIPAELCDGEHRHKVSYIYAGATAPAHRGNGYYRLLVGYALETAAKEHAKAVFLRPANASLMQSYRRMGFTHSMTCRESSLMTAVADEDVEEMDASAYRRVRCALLNELSVPFVDWDERVLAHCLTWCRAICSKDGAALLSDDDGRLAVWERLGAFCVPLLRSDGFVREPGEETTIGLMAPLDTVLFVDMPPVYMGYGME